MGNDNMRQEQQRRAREVSTGRYCRMMLRVVDGGADVTIEPRGGYEAMEEVALVGDSVTVRLRKGRGPRVGRRVMCGHTLIVVKDRRYAEDGTLMLQDEITGGWYRWTEK